MRYPSLNAARVGAAWVLLAVVLAGPAAAHELQGVDAGPVARAVWTDRAPRIDGRLDDDAWQAAPAHGGFVERKPGLRARPPIGTTFRVLYDAEAIYFGVDMPDTSPDAVVARTRTRDTFTIFRDDAISIKLDAAHDHRTTRSW